MQVYELLRDTFMEMGLLTTGLVTGSPSKTVLTDANAGLTADQLINGTLFALDGSNAGLLGRISDNSSTSISIASGVMTVSFSSGDYYGYTKKEFRAIDLYTYVNMALLRCGNIGVKDTSITTATSQTEYTFPVALKKGQVMGVYMQTRTNDSDDNQWVALSEWRIEPATANNTGLLIFDKQPTTGRSIKIEYLGYHPTVSAGTDYINEVIHPELAKAALKLVLGNRRTEQSIGSVDGYNQLYNKYMDEFEKARQRYPIWKPRKIGRIFSTRGTDNTSGEPNKVRI